MIALCARLLIDSGLLFPVDEWAALDFDVENSQLSENDQVADSDVEKTGVVQFDHLHAGLSEVHRTKPPQLQVELIPSQAI